MRLLTYRDDGELIITDDLVDEDKLPRYAILSHTWEADAEEVSFEDIAGNAGKAKLGYEKIRFCGAQAQQDGLRHFWIDTCCIDKANKAELSRAIKSMFCWYSRATRCYVYLSDVSSPPLATDEEVKARLWRSDFRNSRWFTRGWTLQELLAPSITEFFSRDWKKLGDKISLIQQIYETTGIPHLALQGAPLSHFSVKDRLRWCENRQTTRPEDKAYSLLGVVDVDLAPCYGEGAEGAFRRLHDEIGKLEKCIQDIRSTDPRDDKKRIEDTKGGLLKDSYRWILDNASFQQWRSGLQSKLLWVKGDPGKGKTMLLCGIIDELQKSAARTTLVSYFFCQATDSRINSATAVLRGLLYLLVSQQPSLIPHVRKRYDQAGKTMFEDANAWVVLTEIFADVLRDASLKAACLIIDALDECVTDLPKLLEFVAKQSYASSRVKWIVSSRNWPDIEDRLEQTGQKVRLSLELNAESVSTAVNIFVEGRVSHLAQRKKYDEKMRDAVLGHLAMNANGTFLWVALVCQNLEATSKRNVLKKLNSFPPGLDALYKRMMEHISKSDDADLCKLVLASTAIMHRPVTIYELAVLVEQLEDIAHDVESVREIISLCGSFLTVRENVVYFVHQSAKDFLFAEAYDEVFPCGSKEAHQVIFARSLEILSRTLQRDMYDLGALGYPAEEVKPPDPDPLAALRYSCIYWVDHLEQSLQQIDDGDTTHLFLQKHFLHWLEAMSLMRESSKCVHLLEKLQALIVLSTSTVSSLFRDAKRFVLRFQSILADAPLQIYCSALVFAPETSMIRQTFVNQVPKWVEMLTKGEADWDTCRSTLEGHSSWITAVAFSPDGQLVASASNDNTIRLWEAATGTWCSTLEGHSKEVTAVIFSPDGQLVVSASYDNTVRLWEAATGAWRSTLEGHSDYVTAVAFSPDGQLVASASDDNTVRLWKAAAGTWHSTLDGHSREVTAVTFSPDGQLVASASYDNTVRLWDVATGTWRSTLEGHSKEVTAVAFSPDGQLVASASYDETVRLWEATTGTWRSTLEGHSDYITAVAFSPDGQLVASASDDNTIRLWEAATGTWRSTLEGHFSEVTAVAFSPDGQLVASASDDNTIRLWEAATGTWRSTLEGHSSVVTAVAFSPDGQLVASSSYDNTVRLWEAATETWRSTLEGHSDHITAVAFSPDGQLVASASYDNTVRLWEAATGAWCSTLEGHSREVTAVAFSPDGQLVASVSRDNTIRLWKAATGAWRSTLEGHSSWVTAVAFSPDGQLVASASYDNTVRLWEAATGTCHSVLEGQFLCIGYLAFSPDSQMLYTDKGDIPLSLSSAATLPSQQEKQSSHILVHDQWILRNQQRFLWLPFEYRPTCTAIRKEMVCLGHSSGRVALLRLR